MIPNRTVKQIIIPPEKIRVSDKEKLRQFVTGNFLMMSYPILRRFGPSTTIFLSFLINLEMLNEKNGDIDTNGYFMIKRDFISKQIGFTRRQQEVVCKELIGLNLLKCIRKGHGRIGWGKLNHSLINLVIGNCTFDDKDM